MMSVQAYSYAMTITQQIPSRTVQSVLAHLADHADRFGRNVFPSVPTLAKAVHCSDRTIQRSLKWLQEHGYIRRSDDLGRACKLPHHKRPNVYEISLTEERRAEFADEYDKQYRMCDSVKTNVRSAHSDDEHVTGVVTSMAPKPSCESTLLSPCGDSSPHKVADTMCVDRTQNESDDHHEVIRAMSVCDADAFVQRFTDILAVQGIQANRIRRSDRRAAQRLLAAHDVETLAQLVQWCTEDRFWRSRVLSIRAFERRYEELRLDRERHLDQRRSVYAIKSHNAGTDWKRDSHNQRDDTGRVATLVSSLSVRRCPVFGFRDLLRQRGDAVSLAQNHLDGVTEDNACLVCAHDQRNVALHGGKRSSSSIDEAFEHMRSVFVTSGSEMVA